MSRSYLGATSLLIAPETISGLSKNKKPSYSNETPLYAISTWDVSKANMIAGKALEAGFSAIEAAVNGVAYEESNLLNTTVGKGGAPDRDGIVSLDACVMNHTGNCGAVLAVENITHVAALAKEVMEKTPHVILAGKGARQFAIKQGYKPENLLTEQGKKAWKKWLKNKNYKPEINVENHDTIGMICCDKLGNLSGACTTSGLAYKMSGRVGDSPIIGSGLYIDNKVGGAVATGLGEEVIKTVGSFLIVELMRSGLSPQEACEEAVNRILEKQKVKPNFQVAYLSTNINGEVGAYSIQKGFSYTFYKNKINKNISSDSVYK